MYSLVLLLHSWVRWIALVGAVLTMVAALGKGSTALAKAEKWGLVAMIGLDLQLVLGLLLYGMLSPITQMAMQDFGAAMRTPVLRFWAVEHLTLMLGAIVLAHVGRVVARKTADPAKKRTKLLIFFGIVVLLMLAGTPWPGTPNARPLFRL